VTAFAAATDVLFADPHLARDAVYRPAGAGDGIPVRVMLRRPDRIESFGETRLLADTTLIDVRTAELPLLVAGDSFEIVGELYGVQGEPVRDGERLVWTAELRPA
jgi:hypothetical protein